MIRGLRISRRRLPEVDDPETPVALGTFERQTACLAPQAQMYLSPDGEVRACCRNWTALGRIGDRSLLEIWGGVAHRDLIGHLRRDDYSLGCNQCGAEVEAEGRGGSYPVRFDRFAAVVTERSADSFPWPVRIEFNLSNVCNLMCQQCNGLLSSMIRAHRERLPPLPKVYDDQFFADLAQFIPHLQDAQFAGGEPFLAPENFRVWELVRELNPELSCVVVTNATQWNDRIQRVGSTLRMGYTFSIDGMTKATYESIRVNSNFDRVMANVPRYIELARDREAYVEVNFCLMRQNYHEFADLLLWAESHEMNVNVCVVRYPEFCSLASLSVDELRRVEEVLRSRDHEMKSALDLNRDSWTTELERIAGWADAVPEVREKLWWSEFWKPIQLSQSSSPPPPKSSSLGFWEVGVRTTDMEEESESLSVWAGNVEVHRASVDYVPDRSTGDHMLIAVSGSVVPALGIKLDQVHGQAPEVLLEAAKARCGAVERFDVVEHSGERFEVLATLGETELRSVSLAERDHLGALCGATVLFALRPR